MTALENRRRLEQRRKSSLFRKGFNKPNKSRRLSYSQVSAFDRQRTINLGRERQVLNLDAVTAALIKMEVSVLLEDKSNPCTVLSMANALLGSNRVRDLYSKAEDGSNGFERSPEPIERLFLGLFPLPSLRNRARDRETRILKRRYAYVNALRQLEAQTGASTKTLQNWEEARQELCAVFSFPEEEEEAAVEAPARRVHDSAMEDFTKRLNTITLRDRSVGLRPSQRIWQEVANASLSPQIIGDIVENLDKTDQALAKRLDDEYAKQDERQKNEAVELMEQRLREKEAEERAAALMRPPTEEEQMILQDTVYDNTGPEDEIIAQVGTDSIQRKSMRNLRPGCWLNDEAIHYFYVMLAKRDEEICKLNPDRKRSHFFKSFFMTSLLNEGHVEKDGTYEYRNVRRWSKKVPGKNLFNLDKIFFPINQGNMHWVCAVVFMQKKRIQFYDSMGGDGMKYLRILFQYLKDEHQDKRGEPLPDEDQWELVTCMPDTPQQRNGFDCGVFTCMFADFLSKDCPLVFNQTHITQCRERIAISIMNGKAIM